MAITTVTEGQRAGGSKETQTITTSATDTISGYFRVQYDSSGWSNYLEHDASDFELMEALESLDTAGKVTVSSSAADATGGQTWTVTFDSNVGNLAAIVVDNAMLLSGETGSVTVNVDGTSRLQK